MPLTSEDVPQGADPGPNGSIPYGEKSQFEQQQHALASQTGASTPQAQATQGQPTQAPGAAPQGPTQPEQKQPFGNGRLNMNAVFPPMNQPQQMNQTPWRQQIRKQVEIFKHHPEAGPAWDRFNDLIKNQHGPDY